MTGTVKTWKEDRGFGFITPTDHGPDLFVHVSAIRGGLKEMVPGDTVEFEPSQTKRGPAAINVRVINSLAPSDGERAGVRGAH